MSYKEKVLFAIDDNIDTRVVARFLRMMATKLAMNIIDKDMQHCIGMWEGHLEPSYLMDRDAFEDVVRGSGYVDNQICFLVIPGDVRQPCVLDNKDGSTTVVGPMRPISDAAAATNWTYNISTGGYFTC